MRVRKAIRYAINVDELLSLAYLDSAPTPPCCRAPDLLRTCPSCLQFNPEKGQSPFDEAGWVDSNGDGTRDKIIDGKNANLVLRFLVYEEQDNSVRTLAATKSAPGCMPGITCNISLVSYETAVTRLNTSNHDFPVPGRL